MGLQFPFHGRQCTMSSHSSAKQLLESEDIERMDWPALISGSQSHRACMGFSRQTLGSSYQQRFGSFDWRCKTNGQQCLNNSLTFSFSAWADAVKPA
ncbi:hypothetical protein TNCV_3364031 [Trichonephila clavipes]|nr:hypothetical protein TNCV_3364031 [Trichonephila clavipes]